MRCTNNKKRFVAGMLVLGLVFSLFGCTIKEEDPGAYKVYETGRELGILKGSSIDTTDLFAEKLCVAEDKDVAINKADSEMAEAAGVFNLHTQKVCYAKDIYAKKFPASTTKVLTAYVALKYGKPNDIYTVSEKACIQPYDSTMAGLAPGDQISLNDLLYGMMLVSGNDAAVAIAEGVCGNTFKFVDLMNKEAKRLGATHSHFKTVNGLHDDDHYTCVYDMYLIFNAAIQKKKFISLIDKPVYSAAFHAVDGSLKEKTWESTNGYLTGEYEVPEGFSVIGGKTGTTQPAGSCLVLLSVNPHNERVISIVFHADYRYNLFQFMSQLLSETG